jgi:hypothetical protein
LLAASSGNFAHWLATSNGRFVAFSSGADLTVGSANHKWESLRLDRNTMASAQMTKTASRFQSLLSVAAGGTFVFRAGTEAQAGLWYPASRRGREAIGVK